MKKTERGCNRHTVCLIRERFFDGGMVEWWNGGMVE
jgi:hypothetical protein